MTLQQLRQACKLTQQKVAKSLRIGQEGVSKIEKRSDLLISTLRDFVKAMGGQLSLVVEFPDRKPVILSGTADELGKNRKIGQRNHHLCSRVFRLPQHGIKKHMAIPMSRLDAGFRGFG